MQDRKKKSPPDVIDLLATKPSKVPFSVRVQELDLSPGLEQKVLLYDGRLLGYRSTTKRNNSFLTISDEKELATEMLLLRHIFTELIVKSRIFRQAALTIIQNIYLFQNRKIFFGTTGSTNPEIERQEALHLLSSNPSMKSVPLAKAFQHLILARIWNRIITNSSDFDFRDQHFIRLHAVVEKLNTIRNIYILLTTGLLKKLISRINDIYKESVTIEDAFQIGSFGVARAAYRYHHSSGVRFSTYAANWVYKEIQRQSLDNRLIKLSSNTIEQYTRAAKSNDLINLIKFSNLIQSATTTETIISHENQLSPHTNFDLQYSTIERDFESQELHSSLLRAIDEHLSGKAADIIKRRYGFPPYKGKEQSVVSISKVYGVTRGSVYQMEQTALRKLSRSLEPELL